LALLSRGDPALQSALPIDVLTHLAAQIAAPGHLEIVMPSGKGVAAGGKMVRDSGVEFGGGAVEAGGSKKIVLSAMIHAFFPYPLNLMV